MIDNGDPNAGDPMPSWRTVREVGLKTLQETTKDLEVAAWVTEAYVRTHGLAGLVRGRIINQGPVGASTGMRYFRCRMITASKPGWRRSPG